MEALVKIVGGLLIIAVLVFAFGLLFSLPVYWLWNALLPDLFGFKEITWLQSWGLLILCGFLFKSTSATTSK